MYSLFILKSVGYVNGRAKTYFFNNDISSLCEWKTLFNSECHKLILIEFEMAKSHFRTKYLSVTDILRFFCRNFLIVNFLNENQLNFSFQKDFNSDLSTNDVKAGRKPYLRHFTSETP